MKAISIKQPWASLICSGIKDIENRTWPAKIRGRVLVHASAKMFNVNCLSEDYPIEVLDKFFEFSDSNVIGPLSAIIGSVEIVDCVTNHPSIWAEKTDIEMLREKEQIYNWVLANPVLFAEPILNVNGKLSFWDYPMTEEEYFNRLKIGKPLSM